MNVDQIPRHSLRALRDAGVRLFGHSVGPRSAPTGVRLVGRFEARVRVAPNFVDAPHPWSNGIVFEATT